MAYEQFMENKQEYKSPKVSKGKLIAIGVMFILGVTLIGFKYLAWTFPTNSIIHESVTYHEDHNIFLDEVWRSDDTIIITFSGSIKWDVYDIATETMTHNVESDTIISYDPDYQLLEDVLEAAGYEQVAIVGYRIWGFMQVVGVGLVVLSIIAYVLRYNNQSTADFETSRAVSKTKADLATAEINSTTGDPSGRPKLPL